MKFRKLPTAAACPDVKWFEDLPLPTGRTFICTGRELIKLDTIHRTNEAGQVVNIARQLGTDRDNVRAIANSIQVKGVLVDSQPPFLGTNNRLFDGYTRTESFSTLKLEYWVFNIVEPKEGFEWSDVWDEIGLGANDHPPSKAATRDDFSKRLAQWVAVQEGTPSQGDCTNWINNIPHSFTQQQVTNIAEKVLKQHHALATMEAVDATVTVKRAIKELNGVIKDQILPINISGKTDYFRRSMYTAMEQLVTTQQSPVAISFLNGVGSQDVDEAREAGIQRINQMNDLFEAAVQERIKKGDSFKLIDLQYHMPQVIDQETQLIPVD